MAGRGEVMEKANGRPKRTRLPLRTWFICRVVYKRGSVLPGWRTGARSRSLSLVLTGCLTRYLILSGVNSCVVLVTINLLKVTNILCLRIIDEVATMAAKPSRVEPRHCKRSRHTAWNARMPDRNLAVTCYRYCFPPGRLFFPAWLGK